MNRLFIVKCAALISVGGLSQAALAGDGTIIFTGSIAASTCKVVSTNNTTNISVLLPKVTTSSLAKAGNMSGDTQFLIQLTNCDASLTKANVHFEATGTNPVTGNIKNSDDNDAAKNVEIGVFSINGNQIPMNASSARGGPSFSVTNGGGQAAYLARYVATGAASAGKVVAAATYSISYD